MFNTTEEFGQYLQNLIDRHRKDLSILLERNGYSIAADDITPATLVVLYNDFGSSFVQELAMLNFEGDDDLLHAEGDSKLDKLTNVFVKGAGIIGTAGSVVSGLTKKDSTSSTEKTQAIEAPAAGMSSKTKKMIIGGVIAIVVLITIFIVVKRLKK